MNGKESKAFGLTLVLVVTSATLSQSSFPPEPDSGKKRRILQETRHDPPFVLDGLEGFPRARGPFEAHAENYGYSSTYTDDGSQETSLQGENEAGRQGAKSSIKIRVQAESGSSLNSETETMTAAELEEGKIASHLTPRICSERL